MRVLEELDRLGEDAPHALRDPFRGCAGLRGLDSLLSCMIARQLNLFVRAYRAALLGDAHGALERLASQLEPPPILPEKLPKLYSATADALKRLWPELIETVARCGTAQLLRRHIGAQLGTTGSEQRIGWKA